jgi:hypothetical protein
VHLFFSLQGEAPENGSFPGFGWRLLGILGTKAQPSGNSLKTRMPGWRCSADRTRLHQNSLLSGNLTGNFAILGLEAPIFRQQTAVQQ